MIGISHKRLVKKSSKFYDLKVDKELVDEIRKKLYIFLFTKTTKKRKRIKPGPFWASSKRIKTRILCYKEILWGDSNSYWDFSKFNPCDFIESGSFEFMMLTTKKEVADFADKLTPAGKDFVMQILDNFQEGTDFVTLTI